MVIKITVINITIKVGHRSAQNILSQMFVRSKEIMK